MATTQTVLVKIIKSCTCKQFEGVDPVDAVPTDRNEFRHYVTHGPTQPNITGSPHQVGRAFRENWYALYDWLEYSLKKKKAFCFVCRLFASALAHVASTSSQGGGHLDPTFTTNGFDCWKKALEKNRGFHKHSASKTHQDALASYNAFLKMKPVDAQLSDENERQLSARAQAIERNRSVIGRIFRVVRFLARLGFPFRGHDESSGSLNKGGFLELINLLAESGDTVLADHLANSPKNSTYLGPESQNEMIRVVGSAIIEKIVRRVKSANFFSVMMDETTDLSNQEQVSVFVRFVKGRGVDATIEERMLGLVSTCDTTGEALTALLIEVLENNALSLSNIVGQCYDGGSNMRGSSKGVQARVLEMNPNALYTHCYAHNLNRVLVNSVNSIPEVRNFFSIVELLVTFIEASPGRHSYFIKYQRESMSDDETQNDAGNGKNKPLTPKPMSDLRWSSKALTFGRYNKPSVLKAAVATVEHVIETTSDAAARGTAIGICKSVKSQKFLCFLAAFSPVLDSVNVVSETLQKDNIDILSATQQISALKKEINNMRSDEQWSKISAKAAQLSQVLDIDSSDLPQRRKMSRLSNPGCSHRANYFASLDRMSMELSKRFPCELTDFCCLQKNHMQDIDAEERVRKLARRYLPAKDEDKAVAQWKLFRHMCPSSDLLGIYKAIPRDYELLQSLYQIFLTLPVTTASVERSFSRLALVKGKLRTVMKQERLESLLLSTVERDILVQLNESDLVAKFASLSDRRMNLG